MGGNTVFNQLVSLLGTAEDNDLHDGIVVTDDYGSRDGASRYASRFHSFTLPVQLGIQGIDPNYTTKVEMMAKCRGEGNDLDYRHVDISFSTIDKRVNPDARYDTAISVTKIRIDSVVPLGLLWPDDVDVEPPSVYSRYEASDYRPHGYYYMGNFTKNEEGQRLKAGGLVQQGILKYANEHPDSVLDTSFRFIVELMRPQQDIRWNTQLPKEPMLWTPDALERYEEDLRAIKVTTSLAWDFIGMVSPNSDRLHSSSEEEDLTLDTFRLAWNTVWVPGLEMDVKWAKDEAKVSFDTLKIAEKSYESFAEARKVLALIRKCGSIDYLYEGTRSQIGRRIDEDLGVVRIDKRSWINNQSVTLAEHIVMPPGYNGGHTLKNGGFSKEGLKRIHELIDASEWILEDKKLAFAKSVNTLRTACEMAEMSFEKEVLSILGMHQAIGELGEFYCNFWVREGQGQMEENAFTEDWFQSYNFHDLSSNDYALIPIPDANWREDNVRLTTEDAEPHYEDDMVYIEGSLADIVRGTATYQDKVTREDVKIRICDAYVSRADRNYSGTDTTMVKVRAIVKDLARFNVEYGQRYSHRTEEGEALADAVVDTIYEVFPRMKRAIWHDTGSIVWPPAYTLEEVTA